MENLTASDIANLRNWLGAGSINIFGMPFSGKDTHGQELARFFGVQLIGGGDILRAASGIHHVKQHMASGNLAPTEEYLSLVVPYLASDEFRGKPLILSSVGRWHGEEQNIMRATSESGHPMKAVIYLDVNEAEVYKRWGKATRNRDDDIDEDVLRNRLKEFKEKTLPVVDYYEQAGLLINIDGLPPKEDVTAEIFKRLLEFAQTSVAPVEN